ncbi:hypothetical protein ACWV27_05490 [Massilia varians]
MPIGDARRTVRLESLTDKESYETAAGSVVFMLHKVPRADHSVE